ncbi:MAG TPA: DNA primase [Paludibacteraceae bacterium]|nr:DNA primase [Paludibacteraceae bacterium]HPO67526.1 DNA primase [Paludibacteraceae bacterium]
MIDQATIDRIIQAAPIQEVISEYVTLKRRGANLIGLCPFHNEKTPSFTVSPSKGIFKCFGCNKGGNVVHFIMEHEQMTYYEALKFLAKKYNIEVQEKELTPEEIEAHNERESLLLVNDFANKYFMNILHHHNEGRTVGLSYFQERGFREDIIQKFQLGYCLDSRDAFTQAALKEGYKKEFLIKTGLTIESENNYFLDRFRGRVIFPIHSLSGKIIAFGGRVLKKEEKAAKYLNSPESEIYHKSNELYGLYFAKQAIVRENRCYLVEGYADVISFFQSGIENVVASSGTSLTPGQIHLIHRFTENVTVIYDGDAAGIKASLRGIDLLLEEGLNIKVVLLPEGEDPDSFAHKNNASDVIAFIQQNSVDFIRFKTNLLLSDAGNDPFKRANLIMDIVQSIAIIPNPIVRAEYVKECSNLLSVEEQMLYHEINKLIKKQREKNIKSTSLISGDSTTKISSSQPPIDVNEQKFDEEERNILQVLIKYGKWVLYYEDIENTLPVTVEDYILKELEQDQLHFNNALYALVLDEYHKNSQQENFNAENYFLHHTNSEISKLVANLISQKYTLSKIYSKVKKIDAESEKLRDYVERVILEYKNSIVVSQLREKLIEMKKATEDKNEELVKQLMKEIEQLEEIKNQLSKNLGERIIIKI